MTSSIQILWSVLVNLQPSNAQSSQLFPCLTLPENQSFLKKIKKGNFFPPQPESSPTTAVIATVVIAILLMSAVMGVWLVKKYVCGGR